MRPKPVLTVIFSIWGKPAVVEDVCYVFLQEIMSLIHWTDLEPKHGRYRAGRTMAAVFCLVGRYKSALRRPFLGFLLLPKFLFQTSSSSFAMETPKKTPLVAQARQQFLDLFRWKQRVSIIDENGNEKVEYQSPVVPTNPVTLLWQLTAKQWLFYWTGFFCWFGDAFDFHALSIQTSKLSAFYGVTKSDVSTAITLTLLLRSVGAVFFGIAGDYFGRKYPMVLNMFLLGALQIGSIYATTFNQFLATRALFGIAMGGVFGNAAAMA